MKRIVLTVFSLLLLSLASVANANYPTYLNGDRNLILCDGHMGVAWYVDRTTLNVEKYAPPLGSWAETGVSMPAGENAFYLAYKMKFYGSKKFYDSFLKKSICPYGDEFYARI